MKKFKRYIIVVCMILIGCRWVGADNLKVHFIDVREGGDIGAV